MPRTAVLTIPSPSLVVLVGAAGSGKSTFARRHFRPTAIVGTDACRALLADDEADQSASAAAFALARRIAAERLRRRRLTVFDATSVDARARRPLLDLAGRHRVPAVAIVFRVPLPDCLAQDRKRPRRVGRPVIERQWRRLEAGLRRLPEEGFAAVHVLRGVREARRARVRVSREDACDRSDDEGPFDIIGDVHGCARELRLLLLRRLGYRRGPAPAAPYRHPGGRRAVFLGDLVDRGPRVVEAARIVMGMVAGGSALCVPGNHDVTFLRCLKDGAPPSGPGTVLTIRQVEALPPRARRRFLAEFAALLERLPAHLLLDRGRLAVAHAGLLPRHLGSDSDRARRFAIFGQTTGDLDRYGLPVRVKWAAGYRGRTLVVYGHTPVPEPEWIRNTVNIDTGCVYGGRLTALRYPEMELVSESAPVAYYRPRRALPAGVGLRAETRAAPEDVVKGAPKIPGPPKIPIAARAPVPMRAPAAARPPGPPPGR